MNAGIKDTLFRLLRFESPPGSVEYAPVDIINRTVERISLHNVERSRNSDSYRKLLAEFVVPNSSHAVVGRAPYWNGVLRKPVTMVLQELKARGVLIEPNNARARMCFNRDESDLRVLCLEHGLATMGSADQLADRLLTIDPTGWLLGYAGELLQCSELAARTMIGRTEAAPLLDPDVGGLFTQGDFSQQQNLLRDRSKGVPSDIEVIWEMLKGRAEQTARDGDLALCRTVHLAMANHLVRRNNLTKALQAYYVVCMFDLCGARNRSDAPAHAGNTYSRFDATRASLDPWLVSRITDVSREMRLPMDEVREIFLRVGMRLKMPTDLQKQWAVVKLALEGRLDCQGENARRRAIRNLLSSSAAPTSTP
jgi:hypothetical protein